MDKEELFKKYRSELSSEGLLYSQNRALIENRLAAKLIDVIVVQICVAIFAFFFYTSFLIVLIPLLWYFLDLYNDGQSPGKWIMGLQTVECRQAMPPKGLQSLLRNIAFIFFSLGVSFSTTIFGKGLLLLGLAGIIAETYFIFSIQSGLRVGDIVAGTRVFDFKDEHSFFLEKELLLKETLESDK